MPFLCIFIECKDKNNAEVVNVVIFNFFFRLFLLLAGASAHRNACFECETEISLILTSLYQTPH